MGFELNERFVIHRGETLNLDGTILRHINNDYRACLSSCGHSHKKKTDEFQFQIVSAVESKADESEYLRITYFRCLSDCFAEFTFFNNSDSKGWLRQVACHPLW